MCVIGFIRTSFGGPLNSAIIKRIFNYAKQENIAYLGSYIDCMYQNTDSFTSLYNEFQRQIIMVSLKEVYGYAVIASIFILIAILASDYRNFIDSKTNKMLKMFNIWKLVNTKADKA